MKNREKIEYEESSGNVFADLGLPDPEELMAKAQLAIQFLYKLCQSITITVEATKPTKKQPHFLVTSLPLQEAIAKR
jgi:hypothetical protein